MMCHLSSRALSKMPPRNELSENHEKSGESSEIRLSNAMTEQESALLLSRGSRTEGATPSRPYLTGISQINVESVVTCL
jgi:hypothetical protein